MSIACLGNWLLSLSKKFQAVNQAILNIKRTVPSCLFAVDEGPLYALASL